MVMQAPPSGQLDAATRPNNGADHRQSKTASAFFAGAGLFCSPERFEGIEHCGIGQAGSAIASARQDTTAIHLRVDFERRARGITLGIFDGLDQHLSHLGWIVPNAHRRKHRGTRNAPIFELGSTERGHVARHIRQINAGKAQFECASIEEAQYA